LLERLVVVMGWELCGCTIQWGINIQYAFQIPNAKEAKTEYTIRENENTVMIAVKKSAEQVGFVNPSLS